MRPQQVITLATGLLILALSGAAGAQTNTSAAVGWSGSYSFPSPGERQIRLQQAEAQYRADRGGYGAASTTVNNYYTYDHSVGDVTLSAAEGAYINLENRTGDDSGTNSYTVGSINTSNNQVTVTGNDNTVDLVNSSTSTGCQNGAITTSLNQIFDTFDISSGTATSGGAAAVGSSSVSGTGVPCQ